MIVLVAEPTVSGLSDFSRIADLCSQMKAKAALVVNRWDLNSRLAEAIEKEAALRGIQCLGRIPYDEMVPSLLTVGKTPIESKDGEARAAIMDIWNRLRDIE